jgi:ELWxxDGT repeat protein
LFFSADDGSHGRELWRSDGTAEGTVLVKDILPGGYPSNPSHLTAVGRRVFFIAGDGVHGRELWWSDGTAEGTVLVKDISPGIGGYGPSDLTNVGGTLFFVADDGIHGSELWKSDGTTARTVLVKDINTQPASQSRRNSLSRTADHASHYPVSPSVTGVPRRAAIGRLSARPPCSHAGPRAAVDRPGPW